MIEVSSSPTTLTPPSGESYFTERLETAVVLNSHWCLEGNEKQYIDGTADQWGLTYACSAVRNHVPCGLP